MRFVVFFLALFPVSVMAADSRIPFFASAAQLLTMCPVDVGSDVQKLACQNYIVGVVDTMSLVRANEPQLSSHFGCVTGASKPDRLRFLVASYIAEDPSRLDKPAVFIVREAILKAFPCPTK